MITDLEITQDALDSTMLTLTEVEGARIRALILQEIKVSFHKYVKSVGLEPSNVCAYLAGQKRISVNMLKRLLSGTEIRVECRLDLFLGKPSGNTALDALSAQLDDSLFLEDAESQDDTEILSIQEAQRHISYYSERLQENSRTTQENPSKDQVEESSTTSLDDPFLSDTLSQTLLDADQPNQAKEE